MARKRRPAAMPSLRNGLKWRDGRPRWEPSPAARAAGIGGMDLKDEAGAWLERGPAIAAADARALWARLVREAGEPGGAGDEARRALRAVLDALPPARDAADRVRRRLVDDLVQLAHARLSLGAPPMKTPPAARTVQAMIDGYFADVDAELVEISPATAKNYRTMSRRILRRFGDVRVGEIGKEALRTWYVEMTKHDSIPVANLAIGAMGAFLKWASWKEWIGHSPAVKLGRQSNPGRRIIWTIEEERSFIPWCDAHGFADVADAIVLGLWTGARPGDMCAVALAALQARTWKFVPHKTRRSGREAQPGILQPVQLRVERRARAAARATVRPLGPAPFLFNPSTRRQHDSDSLGDRFRVAKAAYLVAGGLESLQPKHVADTRDTCVTRLYLADVALDRIPGWTGHAPDDRDDILRTHYLTLVEEAQLEDAAKLETWAKKEGLAL